jgi:hypothetical protein
MCSDQAARRPRPDAPPPTAQARAALAAKSAAAAALAERVAVLEAAAAAPVSCAGEARERERDAALAAAEGAAADAGAALTEMAAVLAGREAAHAALVETVRALVAQGVPGASETPGATPAATPRGDAESAEGEAERFGALTAYWGERLEAQAHEAMARLRAPAGGGDLPSADGSASSSDDGGSEGAPTPRTAAPKAELRVPPLGHAAKALAPWTPPHALAE